MLAYPSFEKDFVLETDTSIEEIGAIPSQTHEDNLLHPVAYASCSLYPAERRYSITELETLAVVWAISHFHPYLYGHSLVVYMYHAAVRAVLETPKPSVKHARGWTKVYGSGIKNLKIVYRSGRVNVNAYALSCGPQGTAPVEGIGEDEYQILAIQTEPENTTIAELLQHSITAIQPNEFSTEQRRDPELLDIINHVERDELPTDPEKARQITLLSTQFLLVDDILYLIDTRYKGSPGCVLLYPNTFRNSSCRSNTEDSWEHTSLAIASLEFCPPGGGGKVCMAMQYALQETAPSVPLCREGEEYVGRHCIPFL